MNPNEYSIIARLPIFKHACVYFPDYIKTPISLFGLVTVILFRLDL